MLNRIKPLKSKPITSPEPEPVPVVTRSVPEPVATPTRQSFDADVFLKGYRKGREEDAHLRECDVWLQVLGLLQEQANEIARQQKQHQTAPEWRSKRNVDWAVAMMRARELDAQAKLILELAVIAERRSRESLQAASKSM